MGLEVDVLILRLWGKITGYLLGEDSRPEVGEESEVGSLAAS